ncbi:MAG: hypothetical protein IJA67_11655 [Oscillospiraceae bacterium]|nr:hypothetical protein [Oscillospiraceae bacterium]
MTQWIISSSLLIAAVLCIRAIAGDKLSARLRYALWGLVLLRLLIPGSIGESALSVQRWMPHVPRQSAVQQTQPVDLDVYASSDSEVILQQTPVTEESASAEQPLTVKEILPVVYIAGVVIAAAVFLLSNIRFALKLRRSREYLTERQMKLGAVSVYESAAIDTPCLFGFPKAAVYITPEVLDDKNARRHVLAHELTHYRHGDHLWSVLRCVAVALHWYNPLVWAAAILSQKDGELACDEGALRRLGNDERTSYARTLLNLTCVGYKGVLTAATSMTGSESDLKTRIKRIAKNPKMTAAAAMVVAAAMLLTGCAVFTAEKTPEIVGVWQMEVSVLGVGVTEESTGYMEYEFGDGVGRRVDYIDGQIRSAERFAYTLNGDTVTLEFAEIGPVREYTWKVEGDTLTLTDERAVFHLTKAERESVPYLPEEYWAPVSVVADYPNNRLVSDLTETQQAQLMELLRSGYSGKTRKEVMDNDPYMISITTTQHGLTIANGLVYEQGPDGAKEGYELTNVADIEAWLRTLAWQGELNKNLETRGFTPDAMTDIVEARMILYGKAFYADPTRLAFLEELLSEAVPLGFPAGCPFEGILEVTLSDGRVLGVVPALDSCAVFQIDGVCYEYGNKFNTDEGSYGNEELLAMFGLDYMVLEQLWEEVRQSQQQGEVIGGPKDQGDVIRVLNDVMEPTRLPDSTKETIIALLAEGMGEKIAVEAATWDAVYYNILFETMGADEPVLTLSDNGSLYMDGVRYELTTAEAILQILDAHYNELRITVDGYDVTEMSGVVGEFLYPELRGVPEDASVTWFTDNADVCTVTGDAYGAEIYINRGGSATVSVQVNGSGNDRSDSIVVSGQMP